MRLDGVEIKANVRDGHAEQVMSVLGLGDEEPLRIWFYEDTTHASLHPLLDGGVAIRVRAEDGNEDGDCTVKLRPCERSQLTDEWSATEETEDGAEVRIEEDWSTRGKVLAVSCEVDLDPDDLGDVDDETGMPDGVLAADQRRFLDDCATVDVTTETLVKLGPIDATKWKTVTAAGLAELDARAERWQVAGMDLLEVSVRVKGDDVDRAEQVQRDFLAALEGLEVPLDTSSSNKTERVLKALLSAREDNAEDGK